MHLKTIGTNDLRISPRVNAGKTERTGNTRRSHTLSRRELRRIVADLIG